MQGGRESGLPAAWPGFLLYLLGCFEFFGFLGCWACTSVPSASPGKGREGNKVEPKEGVQVDGMYRSNDELQSGWYYVVRYPVNSATKTGNNGTCRRAMRPDFKGRFRASGSSSGASLKIDNGWFGWLVAPGSCFCGI